MKQFSSKNFILIGLALGILFGFSVYKNYTYNIKKILEEQETRSSIIIENSVNTLLVEYKELLYTRVESLLTQNIKFHLKNKHKESIHIYAKSFFHQLSEHYDVEKIIFISGDDTLFIEAKKNDNTKKHLLKQSKLISQVQKDKKYISTFEAGQDGYFYKFIYPIFQNNQYIGLIEVSLNSSKLLNNIKKFIGADIALFVQKDAISNSELKNYPYSFKDFVIAQTTNEKLLSKIIKDKNFALNDNETLFVINDKTYELDALELDKQLEELHIILVHDVTEAYENIDNTVFDFLIYYLILLIFFFIISYLIYFQLSKTINFQYKNLLRQKNEAEKLLKVKSEFLANMSHEIRTPLNAINGFIDILLNEVKDTKILKYINTIQDSSKNLLRIIEDILDLSKIESGKILIDKVDFDVKSEFKIITYLFDAKSSKKNITIDLQFKGAIPKTLHTDILRVKQVLSNLIDNAIKFSDIGTTIVVTISYSNNPSLLHISVLDQGKGIELKQQKKIFQPFTQEDSSTTRKYGGTGLGLSISYELVKLLGGELKLKSSLGVGSEFYFSIPVTIGKDKKEIKKLDTKIDLSNKKILLVEDNKSNQVFMKVLFKKLELNYDIANDGIEALNLFKNYTYDAILMDENMPNMSGIEATKEILKIEDEQDLTHTPIIALTANALKGDREKFLEAGMDEYLTKPLNKDKLLEVLEKFFK